MDELLASNQFECTSITHCTVGILTTGSGNSSVTNAYNLNFNRVNCIDNKGANTFSVHGLICQSYPMFIARSLQIFADSENLVMDGTSYSELCSDPFGMGCAGLILQGGVSQINVANCCGGKLPRYANTGATIYHYWAVLKDGSGNPTAPMMIGWAQLGASGTYSVTLPDMNPGGTIDLIRSQTATRCTHDLKLRRRKRKRLRLHRHRII